MEIQQGDCVKYFFPEPQKDEPDFIAGIIGEITDSYVTLMTGDKVKVKVSFKNFHLLQLCTLAEAGLPADIFPPAPVG